MRKFDEYIQTTVLTMRQDGISFKDIAVTLGVPVGVVSRYVQDAKTDAAATVQQCSYDLTEIARHLPRRPTSREELNNIANRLDAVFRAFYL